MKKGFSLVEMLVVIGIIAILSGVLFSSFSGGSESAKTAQCLANMRNLAAACQSYGAATRFYPLAGSIEWMAVDESGGINKAKMKYDERPGWISWNSATTYQGGQKPSSHSASSSWMTSMYSSDEEANLFCLTNGAIWKYIAGNRMAYVCPSHAIATQKKQKTAPVWSYLMNAYFGWDDSQGSTALSSWDRNSVQYGTLGRADRVLLFAEVPFTGKVGDWQPSGAGSGTDCDCVLQFDTGVAVSTGSKGQAGSQGGFSENIGFNHKSGKDTYANVVFADGHTEKLRLPRDGMSGSQLTELTTLLCEGCDITFDGKQYRELKAGGN